MSDVVVYVNFNRRHNSQQEADKMASLKRRIEKLEVISFPTMTRFISIVGMERFKAILDYLQEFAEAAKSAKRVNGMIDIDFNPPDELREYFIRWGNIPGSEVFQKLMNSEN